MRERLYTIHRTLMAIAGARPVVLMLTVMLLVASAGRVLCLGADGHAVLEVSGQLGCCEEQRHEGTSLESDDGCGVCVDVPLNMGARPEVRTACPAPALSLVRMEGPRNEGGRGTSFWESMGRDRSAMRTLRTVILVI